MNRLNVAVIGAGVHGIVHVRAYLQYPRANLVTVCDTNAERAGRIRQEFGVKVSDDWKALAADKNIHAVSVVTPDFLHRDMVVALLEAGKHVLVEKPLATTTREAREMVQAADKAGKHLMVDFQNRFSPPFVEAKKRIEAGQLGEPVMAWARLANSLGVPRRMLSWSGQSGPQWFLFPHNIDIVCWLFGRRVRRVMAWGRKGVLKAEGMDTYDAIQAMLFFEDCVATVETSWIMPESRPNLVDFQLFLQGTRSMFRLDPLHPILEIAGPEAFEWPVTTAFHEAYGRMQGWQIMPMMHFVDSLLAGKKPECDARDGFHNVAVIQAILKSVESSRPEDVEEL